MKKIASLLLTLVAGVSTIDAATAETELSVRQVNLVVAFPPGGAVDSLARIVQPALSQRLGVTVIVENKAGFSGNIGAQFVARGPKDGSVLLVAPYTSYAVSEALLGSAIGYSLAEDFVPVSPMGLVPFVLATNPSVPATNLNEFTALAKRDPGALTFASSGMGATERMVAEMYQQRTGTKMLHVPYKGGAPAISDLMGGQVHSMFATIPNVVNNVRTGKLKAIAISTSKRSPALPDVPTMAESGVPGFDVSSIYSLLAPQGTPPAILRRLNSALVDALRDPETIRRIEALGVQPTHGTLSESKTQADADLSLWKEVIAKGGIKAE